MTDDFKVYIEALFLYCLKSTGHGEYDINYKWEPTDLPSEHDSSAKMEVRMNIVYLFMTVWIYPQTLYDYENGDLEKVAMNALHEVCHLFIEPVADLFMWDKCRSNERHYRDIIERQTERIRKTIHHFMPDKYWLPENLMAAGFLKNS